MKTKTLIKNCLSYFSGIIVTNKSALTILILVPVILLSGCCINRETFFLPGEVKEYVHFKTGSFWIYHDQNGLIDTFGVTDSRLGIVKEGRESCDEVEYLSIDYISSWTGKKYYSSGSGATLEPTNCLGNTIPWISAGLTYYSQEYLQDTLLLNDYTFYAVYICEFPEPDYANSYNLPFRYYLAKNVGIIQKEYADGSVFPVVDYHVQH